ncbi:hypothetical protein [Arcanobacterium phocae]|uniref:hypothetical protein n=1 Tax=Arcanobacterium phocae TaxID=131112 RepID=UPI001C0ED27F|nr:hypothetical protein [Arcanobacterium phocae]
MATMVISAFYARKSFKEVQKSNVEIQEANLEARKIEQTNLEYSRNNIELRKKHLEMAIAETERSIAASLQAWWACKDGKWYVIVSNSSQSVFHNVEIEVKGNIGPYPVRSLTLPPGTYSFLSTLNGFDEPDNCSIRDFDPITHSLKHSIEKIAFTDHLQQRWCWTRDGLQKLPKE